MPKNSKVHKVYEAIKKESRKEGMSLPKAKAKAATISQAKTGRSLATNKKLKKKR